MSNDVIYAISKARFLSDEQAKEILHDTIIKLSSQIEALKAQVEKSRLDISTLITQNAELLSVVRTLTTDSVTQHLANELQEVKAKNLETCTKFDAFVNAMYNPAKHHNAFKITSMAHIAQMGVRKGPHRTISPQMNWPDVTVDNLYCLIIDAVKAAGMDK